MALIDCPHCGGKVSDSAAQCPKCDHQLRRTTGSLSGSGSLRANTGGLTHSYPQASGFNMDDFLAFRSMISSKIMKILYVLGTILNTICGIWLITTSGNAYGMTQTLYVVWGLSLLILGNLFWRVFCELMMLGFGIHEELVSINKKME